MNGSRALSICSSSSDCSESITSSCSVSVSYAISSCSLLVLLLANSTAFSYIAASGRALLLSAPAAGTRRCQLICPARIALSSKPTGQRPPLLLSIDGTERWTDGRTLDRFINPAPHIMRGFAGSFKNHDVTYRAAPAATSGVERRWKQFTCSKPFQTILNFSHSCAVVYKISTDTAHCAVCLRQ